MTTIHSAQALTPAMFGVIEHRLTDLLNEIEAITDGRTALRGGPLWDRVAAWADSTPEVIDLGGSPLDEPGSAIALTDIYLIDGSSLHADHTGPDVAIWYDRAPITQEG